MSKFQTFHVELEFNDKIVSDEQIQEIAQNIADALVNEASTKGLAPEDADTFTVRVRVTPQYINKAVIGEISPEVNEVSPIGKVDVESVAKSLKFELTDAEIAEVIHYYPEAQKNDPSGNWTQVVEQIIYELKS